MTEDHNPIVTYEAQQGTLVGEELWQHLNNFFLYALESGSSGGELEEKQIGIIKFLIYTQIQGKLSKEVLRATASKNTV